MQSCVCWCFFVNASMSCFSKLAQLPIVKFKPHDIPWPQGNTGSCPKTTGGTCSAWGLFKIALWWMSLYVIVYDCNWLYIYYITYYYTTTMYNNLQHTGIFLVSGFFEIFQVFLENLLTYVFSNLAIFRFGFPHIPRLLKRRETPETESTPTTEAGDENRWITPWVGLWKMGEIFKILYILYICIVYIYIYIYLYLIFLFYTNIRFCWNDTTSWCFYIF